MLLTTFILAAVGMVAVGALIAWANPRRAVNQAVFACSVHGAIWLILLQVAVVAENGLFWLRCTAAVGAMIPLQFWIVKECIANRSGVTAGARLRHAAPWLILTAVLVVVPFTGWFIPDYSTDAQRLRGPGFYFFIVSVLVLFMALIRGTYRDVRALSGARRLEMQIWLGGGAAAGISIAVLMALTALTRNPSLIILRPIVAICFFAATTIAITTSRVFDAKYLLFIGVQKTVLLLTIAGLAYVAYEVGQVLVPEGLALVGTTAVALFCAGRLGRFLDTVFQQYPRASEARSKALAAAMQEMRPDPLGETFLGILRGWAQSDRAVILTAMERGPFSGGGITVPSDSRLIATLREIRWATPERLGRERETPDRLRLAQLLSEHQLGVMVMVAGTGFNVLVAVGVRATRRPFTYPEVQQLRELASIFQTALARSHLWSKAQRAEQLATVGLLGASVAHEIRNPLVTIKSFVHLLPQHYDDRVFRERFFRLISEEVGRIDRLTEQLLDLASPRHYNPAPTSLHQVISSSLDLVATKAEERTTVLHRDLQASPDTIFTDANAARQVLLNLCFNGIQAQEQQSGERWLRLTTRNVPRGVELCVADNGPGIPSEARVHLFQAFHSTKSSGFGLGLAICNEILTSLDATIEVDPHVAGQGAVFRIVFPCPPPTS